MFPIIEKSKHCRKFHRNHGWMNFKPLGLLGTKDLNGLTDHLHEGN